MKSKLLISICALWYILFLGSCTQSEQVTELLLQADSIIYNHPDSVENILNKISNVKLSDRQSADYWRLRTNTHILKRKSTAEDSMIVPALNYYKKHKMQKELKESYRLTLNHLAWKNDSTNYRLYIEEAEQLAKQENDSLLNYTILRSIGNNFYDRKNYESAYQYYVKASEYNDSDPSIFYTAALAYSQIKNNDSIDYWMQKAINLAKQQKDTAAVFHYYRNYADIQTVAKEYDKALINIRNMERYNTYPFSAAPFMNAMIFFQQHKLDSAQYYLKKMTEQNLGPDDKRSFLFTKKGLEVFQNIISYAQGGSFDFQSIGQYTDSLNTDREIRMRKFEEQVLAKQQLAEQNQELIINKQRTQLLLLSILSLALTIAVIAYLYIKRKKDKLYRMEEKMESLQKLLADVSDDLKYSRENSSYFKKVLLQQLGLIRLTASNPTKQNQEMLQCMTKISNHEIPVDSLIVWEDLYALIDSLYDNLYTKMKKNFGDILTEKEIQLCCLLCANFTTKEINVITQQSIRTIYQRKTTIREKLNMQQAEDIVEFINK